MNALAYYMAEIMMAVKCFLIEAKVDQYLKARLGAYH
jgi:hypothetical protein